VELKQFVKVESSAFAFVCLEISNLLKLEISTLLKLENSCLLLFSEGLKFQALEGLKSNVKTDDSSFSLFYFLIFEDVKLCWKNSESWTRTFKRYLIPNHSPLFSLFAPFIINI
jgi:hypothetical protein